MKKLKIKNVEDKQMKLESEMDKYQSSSNYIKNNKIVIIKTLLTTYIQFILFYSVSYWVYCSFGLSEDKNKIFYEEAAGRKASFEISESDIDTLLSAVRENDREKILKVCQKLLAKHTQKQN